MSNKTTPTPIYIFRGHSAPINTLCFFNDNEYLVSGDEDGIVYIWRMRTRRPVLRWKAHENNCLSVFVLGKQLVSQGRDNMIHLWSLPSLDEEATIERTPELVCSVTYFALSFCKLSLCMTPEETLLCIPAKDDSSLLDIYNLSLRQMVLRDIGPVAELGSAKRGSCMAVKLFRLEGSIHILSGYEDGSVSLWECEAGMASFRPVWTSKEHREPILDLAIDDEHLSAISTSADDQIIKYSLSSGDIVKKIKTKKSSLTAVDIRQDNKIMATAGFDHRIRVFSARSMRPLAVLSYHRDSVNSVRFANIKDESDHWLVGGSKDGRISLWNIY